MPQRRVSPSWHGGRGHPDPSKRMQRWLYSRESCRFGYAFPLLRIVTRTRCPPSSISRPPRTLGSHRARKARLAGTSPLAFIEIFPTSPLVRSLMPHPCSIRKTVRRGSAVSVPAWNKSCEPSARSTMPGSQVCRLDAHHRPPATPPHRH